MGLNTRFEVPTARTGTTATSAAIAITWTANEPTPATTQTIADGTTPTVAELGQYVANINAQHVLLLADVAKLRADIAAMHATLSAGG